MVLLAEVDVEELKAKLNDALEDHAHTAGELEELKRRIAQQEEIIRERQAVVDDYEEQKTEQRAASSKRTSINQDFLRKLRALEEAEQ